MKRVVRAMVMGAVLLAGCGRPRTPSSRPSTPAEPPRPKLDINNTATGLTLLMNDKQGRPLYAVRSAKSTQSLIAKNATLTQTSVTLYHEGKPDMYVDAPRTQVDAAKKTIVMWGGLNARAPGEDTTFQVDRMTWSAVTHAFIGTGNVRYRRGPAVFYADHLNGTTPVRVVHLGDTVRFVIGGPAGKAGGGASTPGRGGKQ